jgi:Collagen triple helix repeat (20 copies)
MRSTTITAVLTALVVLTTGAAAASRFVITDAGQIKPSVRAQLRGNQGPRGFTGAQGPQGVRGMTGAQGPLGVMGPPGIAGSARAVAVVAADGTLIHGAEFPKGVTGVSHDNKRGIYCVSLESGIDPTDAVASLAAPTGANGVMTVPHSVNCASGQVEVDTFILLQGDVISPGEPLNTVLVDGGFTLLVP